MSCLWLLLVVTGTALAQTPTITQVLNNYGLEPLNSSLNSGIAKGAIFIVKGSNLSDQTSSLQGAPLATTLLNVRVRIAVSGSVIYAPLYYVQPGQLAGIMPSNTPEGNGTVSVDNNGRTSSPRSIRVVPSAFGTLTVSGNGSGLAAVHDLNYELLSDSNAANPGQYLSFYGSGVGPTPKDETVPQIGSNASGDLTNIPVTVTIGGKTAPVLYRGRTQFPGLDQINVQVPTLDPGTYSCGVIVHINVGGVFSNATRIPIAESGRACVHPPVNTSNFPGLSKADVERIESGGNVKYGFLNLTHFGSTTTPQTSVASRFFAMSGPDVRYYFADSVMPGGLTLEMPPAGSCTVTESMGASTPPGVFYDIDDRYLDAGASLSIQGSGGTLNVPRGTSSTGLITYLTIAFNARLLDGSYTLSSRGGPDIGPFSTTFVIPPRLVWTNRDALQTVTRENGMRITWSGGSPSQGVEIIGGAIGLANTVSFVCLANQKDGSFMVPPSVLNRLPGGAMGTIMVSGRDTPTRIVVPGIDFFYVSNVSPDSQIVTFR